MRLLAVFILAFIASPVVAQDKSPIRLPVVRGEIPPVPMPLSTDVVLTPETIYVVESDVEILAFASPSGSIKLTKESGPLRMRGKFVDGKGVETREFKSKYLLLVDAIKDGRDELIIVPVGAKSESEAKRVFLTVGKMPQPPPGPKPDIDPTPVNSFRVIIAFESGQTMTQAQTNVIYGGEVEAWLNAKCTGGKAGWRRRDKDSNGDEDRTMAKLWDAIKPKITTVPCFAVEVNGKVEIIPVEATPAGMIAKLKTYRGE